MCMAQPVKQVTPTNPAPNPLDQSYAMVTSSTVTPDGKTHGGYTIGQQAEANRRAYGSDYVPTSKTSGANYRM